MSSGVAPTTHIGTSNSSILGSLVFPLLTPVLMYPSLNLMCGPTGDEWFSLCGPSRVTRYLTTEQRKSAVNWGKSVLSVP